MIKNNEIGIWNAAVPFISSYAPEDYKADSQNWAFAQTEDQIIFVGNSAGVLEFDGVRWRLIELPNSGVVRSLVTGDDGKVYVGGSKELGYLERDTLGVLQYRSLLKELDVPYHDFSDVWSVRAMGEVIYFITQQYIFKWEAQKFTVLKPEKSFGYDTEFNEELLVLDNGVGLKIERGGVLIPLPNGNGIKANPALLQFDENKLLVLDRRAGAYLFDFKSILPIKPGAKPLLDGSFLYNAVRLPNGNFLAITLGNGIYVFNSEGELLTHVTKDHGLLSNIVYSAYVDQTGNVWLGTANGINRLELASPVRKFSEYHGLSEGAFVSIIHDNLLYVGCHDGLFVRSLVGAQDRFKKIEGIDEAPRSLIANEKDLWVGDLNGVSLLQGNKVKKFLRPEGNTTGYKLIRSKRYDSIMYVANDQGQLFPLVSKENKWLLNEAVLEAGDRIHHMVMDDIGKIWIATHSNGIFEAGPVTNQMLKSGAWEAKRYDESSGLPDAFRNSLAVFRGTVFSGSTDGLYAFNQKTDTFERTTYLDSYHGAESYSCGLIATGNDNSLWVPTFSGFNTRLFKISAKGEVLEIKAFQRHDEGQVFHIKSESEGLTFVSGPKGVLVYNAMNSNEWSTKPKINIRKIRSGDHPVTTMNSIGALTIQPEFTYDNNDVRFEYALADYNDSSKNAYQIQLSGYKNSWSVWLKTPHSEFTNLPEGDYAFRVRGKNALGELSDELRYEFSILPPWYRTWWAYLAYALVASLMLWGVATWRSRQLRRKNLVLEGIVKSRTQEIEHKNKLLTTQADKLKEMDRMKTRLFANISHEFRTPLTLIKGPVEKLEMAGENKISTTNLKMIRRNANRLLNLVNQLLDLSKLDSGKLHLNMAEGDVYKCLRAAASAFSSHAASRHMDYRVQIPAKMFWASFDRDKLEKIVYNLLSNAFKFTPDEGKISLEATYRSGRLKLKVSDTGSGIAADKLPHIFDRFYQVDDSYTREKAGSGIGLALTKELTELMGGTIYVESEEKQGTLFRVVLPIEEIQTVQPKSADKIEVGIQEKEVAQAGRKTAVKKKGQPSILIIEDNNDMRHFIKEQIETNYIISEAINGREGLKLAQKLLPDLIITDLMMPQMDGITLCKKLKTDVVTSHIPVIMLTAKAGIENKLEGLETGADEYLTKPFNARELQVRTKNLIESRQKLRELFSRNISLDPKEITVTSIDEKFVTQLLELLELRYTDSSFGVPQMQQELAMSKTQLHAKVKALTDYPPGELLRNFRLKRAAQLLSQRAGNVSQVAYDVGFNSLSYFTRCFKAYFKTPPTLYKDQDPKD